MSRLLNHLWLTNGTHRNLKSAQVVGTQCSAGHLQYSRSFSLSARGYVILCSCLGRGIGTLAWPQTADKKHKRQRTKKNFRFYLSSSCTRVRANGSLQTQERSNQNSFCSIEDSTIRMSQCDVVTCNFHARTLNRRVHCKGAPCRRCSGSQWPRQVLSVAFAEHCFEHFSRAPCAHHRITAPRAAESLNLPATLDL